MTSVPATKARNPPLSASDSTASDSSTRHGLAKTAWFFLIQCSNTDVVLKKRKLPLLLILLMNGICTADFAGADPVDWPVLGFAKIVTNVFSAPTCITHARDGSQRLFIVEQNGLVRIIQINNVAPQPFLDITDRVLRGTEQGLLGLAFPPGFTTNRHFYVNYTRKPDGATVISRFSVTTNSNLAGAGTEEILKIIAQPFPNPELLT